MQGVIKWFSIDKGYGYITGNDAQDYWFSVRDVNGSGLPNNGDSVEFEPMQGNKGPRASAVEIKSKAANSYIGSAINTQPSDDRATCHHCGKKMIPRLITYRGEPQKSVCPFCGGVFKKFGCFIATAVYGDYYAAEVIALRRFRDETLEVNVVGRAFTNVYYRYSPPIASFLTRHPFLSGLVRRPLNVLARLNS